MRSWWPTCARPPASDVQLPQVRSSLPAKRRPVRPGTGQDVVDVRRISDAVDFVQALGHRVFLADAGGRAVELVEIGRNQNPAGVVPGPVPIRSRAFTAGWPGRAVGTRYARHVWSPAPSAAASAWQWASAPESPPRFPPRPLPRLVTKNRVTDLAPAHGEGRRGLRVRRGGGLPGRCRRGVSRSAPGKGDRRGEDGYHSRLMGNDLLVIIGGIIAGAIAAVTGFGIGSLLTPLAALRIDTQLAVAVVSVPHLVGTALRFRLLHGTIDRRVLWTFGITSAAGGLAGGASAGSREQPIADDRLWPAAAVCGGQ